MKADRQARILQLISERNIETQEELASLLNEEGYKVTQATMSRDIRSLHLHKVPAGTGHQKYVVTYNQQDYADKYARILKDAYLSCEAAQNIVVIKTVAGMASPVAAALDAMHPEGFLGCVAGDDTVIAAIKTAEEAKAITKTVRDLVK